MRVRHAAPLALLLLLAAAPAAAQDAGGAAPAPPSASPPGPPPAGGAPPAGAAPRLDSLLPRRCGVCHLDKAPAAAPGIIAFTPPARAAAAGDAGMCYSCHDGVVVDDRRAQWSGRHHPASGKVTCGSCHTPHLREKNVAPFMRFPQGSYAFCASCHPGRRPGETGEHPAVGQEKGKAQDCGTCHVVHRADGNGLIRAQSAEGLCGPCHGDNPSREGRGPGKATHVIGKTGPPCLGCHRVHRTVGGRMMLDKAAFDGRLCRQCHERNFSVGKGEPNHPVSGEAASCLSCHRMHNAEKQSGRRGLLAVAWADAQTICGRCHAPLAAAGAGGEWNHPLGGAVAADEGGLGVRLARSGAFFAQGGKLICLSCHRAHGGQPGTPQLVTNREALCLYCHAAQNSLDPERAALGAHPISVRPRRARIDAAFLAAGGVTGPGGELTCVTCHRAHRGRAGTQGLVISAETYSCLLCHTRETSIASTAHSTARAPGAAGGGGLCGGCHGQHGWKIDLGEVVEGQTAIERLCVTCHREGGASFGGATNHPVGIAPPPGRGPSGLPLFWSDGRRYRQGVITCATCHDVHRPGAGGRFLRESVGRGSRDLCLGCHPAQATVVGTRHDRSKDGGMVCSTCHPVHDALAAVSWPTARGGGDRAAVDLADFCGTCHRADGPAAASVVGERQHPVPRPGVKDGKSVGCGACHDPHRWNPADPADRGGNARGSAGTDFLVRSAAGPGDLCAGCHAEQAVVSGSPHDVRTLPPRSGGAALPDAERNGVCSTCHRVHGPQPLAAVAPAQPLKPGAKPPPGSDPCEGCHAPGKMAAGSLVGERSHPVGVSPGQDVGPDLPLYGPGGRRQTGGRIACSTCHDPHRWEPPGGSGSTAKAATSFLRLGADGYAPLCFPCHAEKSMVVGTDHDLRVTAPAAANAAGATAETSGVCGSCHATHNAPPGLALWNRGFGEGLDERTRACTGCHKPGNDMGARVPPRSEAHLVNYPGRGLVRRLFTVTRSASQARGSNIEIYAEDGKRADQGYLSCASCHDVHRWETDVSSSGPGVPAEGDLTNSFLRVRSTALDRTICAECHAESLIEHYRNYHFPEGK
jgi:predicted CXXCH cytochrome family protein